MNSFRRSFCPAFSIPVVVLIGCLALTPTALVAQDDDSEWAVEVSAQAGHHDNFFFRGDGAPAPSSNLLQLGLDGEWVKDYGAYEITWLGGASGTFVPDVDEADYQSLGGGAELKWRRWKFGAGYHKLLNRLFSESGQRVFFDADTVDGWARYSVTERLWLRAEVELDSWDFDASEDGRDSDTLGLGFTGRYAFTDRFAARLSWMTEERDAVDPDQDRDSDGYAIAFEGRPRNDVEVFFRWRQRDREYNDAPFGTSNFGRVDTVDDFVLNIRYYIDSAWGVSFSDEYRTADSTRIDRNYDGNQILAGVFYRFGGGG